MPDLFRTVVELRSRHPVRARAHCLSADRRTRAAATSVTRQPIPARNQKAGRHMARQPVPPHPPKQTFGTLFTPAQRRRALTAKALAKPANQRSFTDRARLEDAERRGTLPAAPWQPGQSAQTWRVYRGIPQMQRGLAAMQQDGWRVVDTLEYSHRSGLGRVVARGGVGALLWKPQVDQVVTFERGQ
jgi:hypothetical protein